MSSFRDAKDLLSDPRRRMEICVEASINNHADSGMRKLSNHSIEAFQSTIREYYAIHGRRLPWRSTDDPYKIMVSEFMLQQTQVQRVIPKYHEFLERFPTLKSLADAPLADILAHWSGLGYNRRALALARTARIVVMKYSGVIPASIEELTSLPGIGCATAGSICAFAFNQPVVFVETNIRTVFINWFFQGIGAVHDKHIIPLVEQTLDRPNPRHWYYGLMDYGVMLKNQGANGNAKSVHYHRQSKFQHSNRQLRGRLIRAVVAEGGIDIKRLLQIVSSDAGRALDLLDKLVQEGFLRRTGDHVFVAETKDEHLR